MKRALWLLAAGTVVSGVCAWSAVGRPVSASVKEADAPAVPAKPAR
ncbi:MAG: hypothetical protein V4537_00600 [Pseudomonadota bacterium]